jgi:bifunctional UDP-N-acetylglucosamine pyrophosphorylase / glucosamine-1-phosphate N-acetyltransferase
MNITTVILAAGKGTRMRSDLPKVMHKIAGKPLLEHVYDMSAQLGDTSITIIYGHGGDYVKSALSHLNAGWVEQREQKGTGHAVQQVADRLPDADAILILYGDVPLLKAETVNVLLSNVSDSSMGLLTMKLADPAGYGRIVRDAQGLVQKIVEEKDASSAEKQIDEINTGIMAVKGDRLKSWLSRLQNNNAQGEYYLTDIIQMAVNENIRVITNNPLNEDEVMGVNNRQQLSHLERVFQLEQANSLMEQGVTLRDPSRFDLRGRISQLGQDIEIDFNVLLEGDIKLGNNVKIGVNTHIINSTIGDNVEVLDNCVIENAVVGEGSRVGPFARLRPDTVLAKHVHVGNFVEIKKSNVADKSKINHLSYIGDTEIGSGVNVGAGTITCNYDGVNKFKTIIEDGAFIGSDTQLVAPVTIGKNATIGAGSTITKDCPENQLTISRVKQFAIPEWQRPVKKGK